MMEQRFYLPPRVIKRPTQFLPFKPSWLNKLKNPLQSYGYYVLISHAAHGRLSRLGTYHKLVISQLLFSLASHPRPARARRDSSAANHYLINDHRIGISLYYKVYSGRVYVMDIRTCPAPQQDSCGAISQQARPQPA